MGEKSFLTGKTQFPLVPLAYAESYSTAEMHLTMQNDQNACELQILFAVELTVYCLVLLKFKSINEVN